VNASSPGGRDDRVAARQSLHWRLPALISLLVTFMLAAFLYTAYREVEGALLRAGGQRARGAAEQVANLLERSTQQRAEQFHRVAAAPEIRHYLSNPSAENREAARAALAPLARSGPRRIIVWTRDETPILDVVVPPTAAADTVAQALPPPSRPGALGLNPFHIIDGQIAVDWTVDITDEPASEHEPAPRLGFLTERAMVSVNPPGILGQLVGDDAVVEVGNRDGDIWTNLTRVVTPPPVDRTQNGIAEYRTTSGEERVGAVNAIRNTPWAVWVEFRRADIVAPARTFLRRMIALGLIFAGAGAWLVRLLTVPITAPLTDMTSAAEAIAAGDYHLRVPAQRRDEIGRLGHAFNIMTAQVEEAYHRLESRVQERTRDLHDALAALSHRSDARDAYLATIVESSDDGIIGTSLDGNIQSWNRGAEQLFGYHASETMGTSIARLSPPGHADIWTDLLGRLKAGEHARLDETILVRHDGTQVDVSLAVSPIRDAGGDVVGASVVARNVSDRKRLEAQLRQAQKMEAIGQLAGGVAHDFNNLLTAILGYANLLAEDLEATDRRRDDVEEIRKAAQRAAGLTNQLLAFSRKQMVQPKLVDLNALIIDTSRMMRRLIGEHIQLDTRLSPDLAVVRADPGQIEQIVVNLAVNARDAMPEGGRLSIETANVELDNSYRFQHVAVRPGHYVMVAVSDTGVGMDEETQRRVFEPFFTTKERGKGTGLGLATVYGIVKQSGGYIWVYSEMHKGTTFKVYLPRARGEIDTETPARTLAPTAGAETVLIVEDEAAVRFLVRTLLERAGYRVLEAESPPQAEALFEQHADAVDLVVADVVMPGSSGPTLFQRFAARRPGLKVLYMSGYTDEHMAREGRLDTDVAFLQKPFTADGLLRKIRDVLEQ
jgi:two-component system cell cycle sensor histidine kinase/response regulator CckA